jgi:hypothetical protein
MSRIHNTGTYNGGRFEWVLYRKKQRKERDVKAICQKNDKEKEKNPDPDP